MAQLRPCVVRSSLLGSTMALALLSAACSAQSVRPIDVNELLAENPYDEVATLPELEGESGPIVQHESPRRVGDKWVHRFSGSFHTGDLILREEVVAERGGVLLVDYILAEGESETHLQVEMAARSERIIRVSRMIDGEPHEAQLADFEAMMAKTTFVPDQNEGKIAKKGQTCLVGKKELDCELSEYKVRLGDQEATMTVAHNDEIKRDVSGEITAVDGTVLYHAELIEMQRGKQGAAPAGTGVAQVDLSSRE